MRLCFAPAPDPISAMMQMRRLKRFSLNFHVSMRIQCRAPRSFLFCCVRAAAIPRTKGSKTSRRARTRFPFIHNQINILFVYTFVTIQDCSVYPLNENNFAYRSSCIARNPIIDKAAFAQPRSDQIVERDCGRFIGSPSASRSPLTILFAYARQQ